MEYDIVVKKLLSIKKFSLKKPPIHKIVETIESANLAPTPGNLHIIRYILVDNIKMISEIADACQQDFIKKAPYVIVISSDNKQVKRLYGDRSDKHVIIHVGTAIENLILKVTDLGLASSPVPFFADNIIRRILGIPDEIEIHMIIPIGYELVKGSAKPVPKQSLYNRLFFNRWGNRFYKQPSMLKRGEY